MTDYVYKTDYYVNRSTGEVHRLLHSVSKAAIVDQGMPFEKVKNDIFLFGSVIPSPYLCVNKYQKIFHINSFDSLAKRALTDLYEPLMSLATKDESGLDVSTFYYRNKDPRVIIVCHPHNSKNVFIESIATVSAGYREHYVTDIPQPDSPGYSIMNHHKSCESILIEFQKHFEKIGVKCNRKDK